MADERSTDASEVATDLARAMTRLRARLRVESAPPDMDWTWSQLMTLGRIVAEGPTTGAALAKAEHVRPQSMHETISNLRANGLVTTSPDPADRRKLLVSATKEARRLMKRIPALREAWLEAAIVSELDDQELAALGRAARVMGRLADCDVRLDANGRKPSGS